MALIVTSIFIFTRELLYKFPVPVILPTQYGNTLISITNMIHFTCVIPKLDARATIRHVEFAKVSAA